MAMFLSRYMAGATAERNDGGLLVYVDDDMTELACQADEMLLFGLSC